MKILKKAWLVQAFLICAACATVEDRKQEANDLIAQHGFEAKQIPTPLLPLFSASKPGIQADPLHVVIEGDGYAWVDRSTLSDNPTPRDPIGLKIATSMNPPGYYLARPCQYVSFHNCDPSLWSSERFAPRVIDAYMEALDQIKVETHSETLHLVGFSGGAYIAEVLASRRDDIAYVTTIAGLLDPDAWTSFQDISPVETAEPIEDTLTNSAKTSFIHICAGDDEILPCTLTQEFYQKAKSMGLNNHALIAIKDEDHDTVWEKALPAVKP